MPLSELVLSNPLVIAEEGKPGKDGFRALLVSGDEASRTRMHEAIPAQVFEQEDGYTEVLPVWKFLKFGQWQLFAAPKKWEDPHADPPAG